MDSDSEPSSSEEELREMLRKDQNIDEKNIGLLTKQKHLEQILFISMLSAQTCYHLTHDC